MTNPYQADFQDPTGTRDVLVGEITFTDPDNQPGGGSQPAITDMLLLGQNTPSALTQSVENNVVPDTIITPDSFGTDLTYNNDGTVTTAAGGLIWISILLQQTPTSIAAGSWADLAIPSPSSSDSSGADVPFDMHALRPGFTYGVATAYIGPMVSQPGDTIGPCFVQTPSFGGGSSEVAYAEITVSRGPKPS